MFDMPLAPTVREGEDRVLLEGGEDDVVLQPPCYEPRGREGLKDMGEKKVCAVSRSAA